MRNELFISKTGYAATLHYTVDGEERVAKFYGKDSGVLARNFIANCLSPIQFETVKNLSNRRRKRTNKNTIRPIKDWQ